MTVQGGEIIHYNGTSWSKVLSTAQLNSVWGSSASDVWAGGCCGSLLLHFNGAAWSNGDMLGDAQFRGVWGTSSSNVWAVGDRGIILHYDGTTWSSVPSGTTADLRSVWGTSSSNVWAVAVDTILHYDGSSWSVNFIPFNALLQSVWGSSASDVWAVGNAGVQPKAFHYDGSAWSGPSVPTVVPFGVWGTGPNNFLAVGYPATLAGSGVSHWDGNRWTAIDVGSSMSGLAIWGSSNTDIWIVGLGGSILHGTAAQ